MGIQAEHDERWFEALWSDHADQVMAYARRRSDHDVAREVVAGTFLVAWRRRDDVPAEPLPWLYGVARRVLADQRRTIRRQANVVERLDRHRADAASPVAADPSTRVAEHDAVVRALERLGEGDREALRLACWEQLTPREAADALGCSPATFSVRLHRARRRLRRQLDALDDARSGPALATDSEGLPGLSTAAGGAHDAG